MPTDPHAHLTGTKADIVKAVRDFGGWLLTDEIATTVGRDVHYVRRLLVELHDEGIVNQSRDPGYQGRGQAPHIWALP